MTHPGMLAWLLVAVFVCTVAGAQAQEVSYALSVSIEASSETAAAAGFLRSTVAGAAQRAGLSASSTDNKTALFETRVRIHLLTSRVVHTPEPRVVMELQLDFNSVQVASERSHGTLSALVKGMGRSQSDAIVAAVRAQPDLSKQLSSYYDSVQRDITRYFEQACPAILQNATATARQGDHEAAIYALTQVPPEAELCWGEAQEVMMDLIDEMARQQCSTYLIRAKSQWSASKSRDSAQKVADALTRFYPGIQCDDDVDRLLTEVARTIAAYDRQAAARYQEQRAHALRMYNDQLRDRRTNATRSYQLAEARIEAFKTVGVELARSVVPVTTVWRTVFR